MTRSGPKPKGKVTIKWSPEFAYAIGLLATDGNLASIKRHITLVSNDIDQVKTFKRCLRIDNKITRHQSGVSPRDGFRVQFGDVLFYAFLNSIGITARKSLTIGRLKIPTKYYFDFLLGHFDGDGTFWSYWDKRWRSSFMFYMYFYSASKKHIRWIQQQNQHLLGIKGHVVKNKSDVTYSLRYAKRETIILVRRMYRTGKPYLYRKYLKIQTALGTIGQSI